METKSESESESESEMESAATFWFGLLLAREMWSVFGTRIWRADRGRELRIENPLSVVEAKQKWI